MPSSHRGPPPCSIKRDAMPSCTEHAIAVELFSAVRRFQDSGTAPEVQGGWVYALGQGSLADSASTPHRRDRLT